MREGLQEGLRDRSGCMGQDASRGLLAGLVVAARVGEESQGGFPEAVAGAPGAAGSTMTPAVPTRSGTLPKLYPRTGVPAESASAAALHQDSGSWCRSRLRKPRRRSPGL